MKRRTLFLASLVGYALAGSTTVVLGAVSLIRPVPLRIGLPAIGVAFVAGLVGTLLLALFGPTGPIELDGDGS